MTNPAPVTQHENYSLLYCTVHCKCAYDTSVLCLFYMPLYTLYPQRDADEGMCMQFLPFQNCPCFYRSQFLQHVPGMSTQGCVWCVSKCVVCVCVCLTYRMVLSTRKSREQPTPTPSPRSTPNNTVATNTTSHTVCKKGTAESAQKIHILKATHNLQFQLDVICLPCYQKQEGQRRRS